jgi:hypothetical protein
MNEIQPDERVRLSRDVATLWPGAPSTEAGHSGRWLRFHHPAGGTIYLQRYAWDEPCLPHFLVVTCGDEGVLDQRRYETLVDAVVAIRTALGQPDAERSRAGRATPAEPRPQRVGRLAGEWAAGG